MRTTLNIVEALAEEAKERAALEGRTFTSRVEEGLRRVLSEPSAPREHVPLPAWMGGGQQLLDLEDRDALWAVLDEDGRRDPARRERAGLRVPRRRSPARALALVARRRGRGR